MGQISGVDAALITSIAGVAVANISYVGPTSAATIGLGGGGTGKQFAQNGFNDPNEACAVGPRRPTITLYYNSGNNQIYTDPGFTTFFDGQNLYWYNLTDNQWWIISEAGRVGMIEPC